MNMRAMIGGSLAIFGAVVGGVAVAEAAPVFECNLTHRFDMLDAGGQETEATRNWLKRAPRASFDAASGLLRMRDVVGQEVAMLKYRVVAQGDKNNDWVAISADLPLQWSVRIRVPLHRQPRIMLTEAGMVTIGTCK